MDRQIPHIFPQMDRTDIDLNTISLSMCAIRRGEEENYRLYLVSRPQNAEVSIHSWYRPVLPL